MTHLAFASAWGHGSSRGALKRVQGGGAGWAVQELPGWIWVSVLLLCPVPLPPLPPPSARGVGAEGSWKADRLHPLLSLPPRWQQARCQGSRGLLGKVLGRVLAVPPKGAARTAGPAAEGVCCRVLGEQPRFWVLTDMLKLGEGDLSLPLFHLCFVGLHRLVGKP